MIIVNKQQKRLALMGLLASTLLFLSGCVSVDKAGNPTGWVWNLLGQPMSNVITYFAENLGFGFGVGIILVTIIVRLVILPLGLHQSRGAAYQAAKREYLAPILEPINERMRNAETQEEKMAAQAELMQAQRENGLSLMGGVGCLPLLIQLPFFSALYYAARYTPGVLEDNFLWFNLGQRDFVLIAIIAALYYFQSWLSIQSVPEEQRQQMRATMYTMPLMMIFFGFSSPAAVILYWLVGGIFSIIQQLIANYIIKPRLKEKVAEEFKNNPPKAPRTSPATRKDVTPKNAQAIPNKAKKNRNAGKQKR